jgi:putative ABC transport system permease protein
LTAALLVVFACLALVITAAGIAGVIGFSVSQRSREIGIRMALGAREGAVLWMILRQGTLLVAAGLSAGILGGLAFSQVMKGLLFQVQPNDLLTFVGVSLVLAIIGAAACILPAHRATTVDPTMALRSEP